MCRWIFTQKNGEAHPAVAWGSPSGEVPACGGAGPTRVSASFGEHGGVSTDAPTLAVVNDVKKNLPRFRSVVHEDIKITHEFDQSSNVKNALTSVVREGLLGALLPGLVVLPFFA